MDYIDCMDWFQILLIILANAGLIFWFRSESRADTRRCEDLISAIHLEMKDFHGRLCSFESRTKE